MGWLEKIGLVERDAAPTTSIAPAPAPAEEQVTEPLPDVDAEIDTTDNIISEIYAQNDLADKSSSIFTIQALINTLPPEMTTATKQNTVAGILAVSGKSVKVLLDDADRRAQVLRAAGSKVCAERTEEINAAKSDIEELKRAIECANIKIKEAEDIIAATEKTVNDELKQIAALVDFCSGMEPMEAV